MDKLACQREWAISCGALRRNIRPGCCAFRKHSSKCSPPSSSGESAEGISGAGCFTHSRLLRMCGRGSRDGSRRMLMLCAKPAHRKVRDEWGTRQIGDADLLIVEKPAPTKRRWPRSSMGDLSGIRAVLSRRLRTRRPTAVLDRTPPRKQLLKSKLCPQLVLQGLASPDHFRLRAIHQHFGGAAARIVIRSQYRAVGAHVQNGQ